jgi:hypothetical protein
MSLKRRAKGLIPLQEAADATLFDAHPALIAVTPKL